ncbi:MAG: hypothetical protein Q9207_005524 [Kuettlingeria erythrocarpa]
MVPDSQVNQKMNKTAVGQDPPPKPRSQPRYTRFTNPDSKKAFQTKMTAINAMDALPMSKAECHQRYLQYIGEPYSKIVIGALILMRESDGSSKILLKRAAHEEFYPNIFEIPGGKVEDIDPSIWDAVRRQVYKDTGMDVVDVIDCVRSFEYSMKKTITKKNGVEESVWFTTLQHNFICETANHELTIDPAERSEGRFIARSEVGDLEMTEQMRAVVEEGFDWIEGSFLRLASFTV